MVRPRVPVLQGANVKKYVVGTNAVNGFSVNNNSGVNTYMMRLAEVYLNYAEATLGNDATTTDATALGYFNELRTRAGVPAKSKIGYEDIRHEFRVELAFEGLYWYFLVRRGYYEQQEVVNYVNNQHRNASYYESSTHTYKLSDSYAAHWSECLYCYCQEPRAVDSRDRLYEEPTVEV